MSRFATAALALIILPVSILCSSPAFAQKSTSKVEVFAGYSLLLADNGGLTGSALDSALGQPAGTFGVASRFNGWNGEVQYNLNRYLGVVADGAKHSGQAITSSNVNLTELPNSNDYSLMGGAVLFYKVGKLTPFVHGLVGLDRAHLSAGSVPGLFGLVAPGVDHALAAAVGGGVDYKLAPHFAVRLGQFDYFYTAHDLNSFYAASFRPGLLPTLATRQNNLRFAAGFVIRF
jgi:opacity protein-like surface antigen